MLSQLFSLTQETIALEPRISEMWWTQIARINSAGIVTNTLHLSCTIPSSEGGSASAGVSLEKEFPTPELILERLDSRLNPKKYVKENIPSRQSSSKPRINLTLADLGL